MVRQSLPNFTPQQERGLYAGVIKAAKLGKHLAEWMQFEHTELQEQFIQAIHQTIFEKTFPAIAGKYRNWSPRTF